MKKLVLFMIVGLLVLSFAGCGGGGDTMVVDPNTSAGANPDVSGGQTAQSELYFETDGVKIRPYDLISDVVSKIGEPADKFEAPSCAYQGMDVFYYYGGFQFTVNDVDGADHVTVIMVVDDTVTTPEGLKIGQTEEEMKSIMGAIEGEGGLYNKESGTTTLTIQIKEGKVFSIMYTYTAPKQ